MNGFILKTYRISTQGEFPAYVYYAGSRQKALRDAWHGYCNYRHITFKEWLRLARCWKEPGSSDPKFGHPIKVGGKPAFFVTSNNQYVQFVRPDSDVISNAHPYDVEPEEFRPWTYRKETLD